MIHIILVFLTSKVYGMGFKGKLVCGKKTGIRRKYHFKANFFFKFKSMPIWPVINILHKPNKTLKEVMLFSKLNGYTLILGMLKWRKKGSLSSSCPLWRVVFSKLQQVSDIELDFFFFFYWIRFLDFSFHTEFICCILTIYHWIFCGWSFCLSFILKLSI